MKNDMTTMLERYVFFSSPLSKCGRRCKGGLAIYGIMLSFMLASPAFCEKLDLLGFTPGMSYQDADASVAKFRFCKSGNSIEGILQIVCDSKVILLFSPLLGEKPVLMAVQMPIRTTDNQQTVLADISKQFDGKAYSKDLEPRTKESLQMSSSEYVNYFYWTLPQGLQLQYIPDRGIPQPAPASGTLMLQKAELIQMHKDIQFQRSRRSVPRL